MGQRGYLAGLLGMHYQSQYTENRVASVPPEKWDLFHEMLLTDELSRAASGGFVWNVIGGFGIGCPPLVKFGKKALVDRILPGILNGDKRICLAITEPDAGSDVANLTCEAKLSEDGKHYIVNGEKKWITNGIWSDYFTTAVRTGGEGMNGISVLLIERSAGGVSTRKMDCQGVWSSGTTYITFEDVKVPVENLIGKENQGFKGKTNLSNFPKLTPSFKYSELTTHSHHDELQPRAHRDNNPMRPLLPRLLRRVR
jgi:alkylation response protein AidB-like acyl-CoA dehydrogenase